MFQIDSSERLSRVKLQDLLKIIPHSGAESLVVGALIFNERGEVFVQRRAYDRSLFPGCWDVVGGHVEENETLLEALSREVQEETGWQVSGVLDCVKVQEWESSSVSRLEYDFVVTVNGDLANPILEVDKHIETRWIGHDNLAILRENREDADTFIEDLVCASLSWYDSSSPKSLRDSGKRSGHRCES